MEKIISKPPLHSIHKNLQAKMANFAGYDMPISYPMGTIKEHLWCREHAGLFDVSHMGQLFLVGENVDQHLSRITPISFPAKAIGKSVYTHLLNEQGGIVDDLIATRISENRMYIVVNAACKEKDIRFLRQHLPQSIHIEELPNRSLIALQGPKAEMVLQKLTDVDLQPLKFMSFHTMNVAGIACYVTRSGYTGEDGFEVSVDDKHAIQLWNALSENEWVEPVGLAARDTLRLEAGLPLYGQDLTDDMTPVEASLSWIISKNHDGFLGSEVIMSQLQSGVERKLVGIKLLDKGIARVHSQVVNEKGELLGEISSGGYSPTLNMAIGFALLNVNNIQPSKEVFVVVRGKQLKAKVTSLRFY
ncbi:MAG: Aminomethyltransferase, partial [Proteobacteria bacterium]